MMLDDDNDNDTLRIRGDNVTSPYHQVDETNAWYATLQRMDRLYVDHELLLKEKIRLLEEQIVMLKENFDSPEHIATLRDEMHFHRREHENTKAKLTQAEAFIMKQTETINSNVDTINDLRRRCKELEEKI